MFRDRIEAGQRLAAAMRGYERDPSALVLGIPRGGVVVAAEVARILGVPLDIVVASKIGAPGNAEYAVGAVDADGAVMLNELAPVPDAYVREAAEGRRREIARRLRLYRGDRSSPDLTGRTSIVVDDGIATGLTMRATVRYLKRHGAARIVVAAPVMPPETAAVLRTEADEVVALETPQHFSAVGQFYVDFAQTSDAEVIALLGRSG